MKCLVDGCFREAESGPYCLRHAKHVEWTNNSDYDNMGIVLFSQEVFPHMIDSSFGVPDMHKRIYADLLDARLNGADKMDRLHAIAAPREHSKSTIANFIYPIYCLLYGYARFVVTISESSEKTKQFIRMVKDELEYNETLKYYFGEQAQRGDDAGKWTETHILLRNGGRMIALGMGKNPRGLNERTRPDLIIADDVESESNTITEEVRRKNWSWWKQATVPAADMIRGQCVYIGTMVHYDCILNRLLTQQPDYVRGKGGWRKHFYQVYTDDTQTETIWPQKFPVERIAKVRRDYVADPEHGEDQFYMEYMNIANSPASRRLHSGIRIGEYEYRRKEDMNWVYFPNNPEAERYENVHISVGVDPASSTKSTAKYTGIIVLATTGSGTQYVLAAVRRRMHLVQGPDDEDPGLIDVLEEIMRHYHPDSWAIETTGIGRPISQLWKARMNELTSEPALSHLRSSRLMEIEAISSVHKDDNIINTLEIPLKSGSIQLLKDHVELAEEMKQFPKGRFKDLLDALCDARKGSRTPQRVRFAQGPNASWRGMFKKKSHGSWMTRV